MYINKSQEEKQFVEIKESISNNSIWYSAASIGPSGLIRSHRIRIVG